jgi:hypothetical protein
MRLLAAATFLVPFLAGCAAVPYIPMPTGDQAVLLVELCYRPAPADRERFDGLPNQREFLAAVWREARSRWPAYFSTPRIRMVPTDGDGWPQAKELERFRAEMLALFGRGDTAAALLADDDPEPKPGCVYDDPGTGLADRTTNQDQGTVAGQWIQDPGSKKCEFPVGRVRVGVPSRRDASLAPAGADTIDGSFTLQTTAYFHELPGPSRPAESGGR